MTRAIRTACLLLAVIVMARPGFPQVTSIVPLFLNNPALDLSAARRLKNVAVSARLLGLGMQFTALHQAEGCITSVAADRGRLPRAVCR